METTSARKRKSEKLTPEEHKAFKKYVASFPTKIDATEALNVTRPTLDGLIFRGSGRPETIEKVRKAIAA